MDERGRILLFAPQTFVISKVLRIHVRRFFAFLSEAIAHWQKSEKSFSFFVDKCKSDRVVDKFYCFAKATHMCVKSSFKAYKT